MTTVKLLAVGDVCLQTRRGKDPFEMVKGVFKDDSILFGNLETVLSNRGKETERFVPLHVSPEKVVYLKNAGFDILNIANNHVMDMGPEGFDKTLQVLDQNNIAFVGGGNRKFGQSCAIVTKNNIRLGFLAYNKIQFPSKLENDQYVCNLDKDNVIRDINKIKTECDVIIISLHWGIENVFYPSPDQINLARNFVEEGASLILGHHPSVVQGIENYKSGLIVYSLGNFQFIDDAHKSIVEKTKETMILSVDIKKNGIKHYQTIPVKIDDDYIPSVMDSEASDKMLSFIDSISRPIINGKINEKWWFAEIAQGHLVSNISAWIFRIKKYGIKHAFMCFRWLISRFQVKCYTGLLRYNLRKYK